MAATHPAATHHLPWFISAPGETDYLYVATAIVLVLAVFLIGVIFFRLHSLPERLGHRRGRTHPHRPPSSPDRPVQIAQPAKPGTIAVVLEPLFENGLDGVTPGSRCIANAYTSDHDRLTKGNVGAGTWLFLHAVDAVGLVHAMLLRIQALVLPIQTLVFAGH